MCPFGWTHGGTDKPDIFSCKVFPILLEKAARVHSSIEKGGKDPKEPKCDIQFSSCVWWNQEVK